MKKQILINSQPATLSPEFGINPALKPPMIRFARDLYMTGFTLIFRLSRSKNPNYRAGGAVAILALIEALILFGIFGCVQISAGKQLSLSKFTIILGYLALSFANAYPLIIRHHGTNFERGFDRLRKTKRTLLVVTCSLAALAALAFFIWSGLRYRASFGLHY